MYSVRILTPAIRELEKLDHSTSVRIADRIQWLSEHLDSIKLFPLKGELKGLYRNPTSLLIAHKLCRKTPYQMNFAYA